MTRLVAIEALARTAARVEVLATVDTLPIHAFTFGSGTPTLRVTAGVHGVEQIGTDVAITYLTTLLARLRWDRLLHDALARCRVIVVPLVNPVGMARGQRANGRGVDLMRNAPPAVVHGARDRGRDPRADRSRRRHRRADDDRTRPTLASTR